MCFLTVSGGWTSPTAVTADSVSGEGSLPGLQMATFPPRLHVPFLSGRLERGLSSSEQKDTISVALRPRLF